MLLFNHIKCDKGETKMKRKDINVVTGSHYIFYLKDDFNPADYSDYAIEAPEFYCAGSTFKVDIPYSEKFIATSMARRGRHK